MLGTQSHPLCMPNTSVLRFRHRSSPLACVRGRTLFTTKGQLSGGRTHGSFWAFKQSTDSSVFRTGQPDLTWGRAAFCRVFICDWRRFIWFQLVTCSKNWQSESKGTLSLSEVNLRVVCVAINKTNLSLICLWPAWSDDFLLLHPPLYHHNNYMLLC